MAEVMRVYPGAQRALMRRYHIGGCSSCGFSPEETLSEVLERHDGLDLEEVLAYLHDSQEQEERIQISPRELADALRGERAPKVIDVRQPEEQAVVMLEGAIPATRELVQEMMNGWPKDTPIVTCCHRGMRSLDAASYLIGHGFTNVRSLRGGIEAWAAEIDPSLPRY
jgi:rhodanese-related sulfurtransferase